jgi:hypothetical protein
MICWPKFRIANPVILTSPLRKLELLTRPTPSWVSFNHFPHSTKLLLLSFRRQSRHSQTFPRLTTRLGALVRCLAVYEASSPRVTNASWVLDVALSAHGLGLVLTTQISPPNSRILHLRLGSHKERLGRAQEAVKRLWKWSGTSNPWEWGWSAFYRESKKLAVGAIRLDRSDRSYGDPNWAQGTQWKKLSELAILG